jgi:hypothetical protein
LAQTARLAETATLSEGALGDFLRVVDPAYAVEDGAVGCAVDPDPLAAQYGARLARECVEAGRVADRWFGVYGQIGEGRATIIYDCREADW